MTTTALPATAAPLRTLYYARSAFAFLWAVLLVVTASSLDSLDPVRGVTVALLVLYPLVDVAAAVVDLRSARAARPGRALYVNVVLSLLAAGGLAVAVGSDLAAVLRVWGVWAVTAGIVQLLVAVGRRRLGGQWAQVLSGGISVLAGGSFLAQAGSSSASLGSVAGYATLGGVFFLVSAVRLHRAATARR
jgi:uncharacterized membrane protein HdeD (DUF308 family)